MSGRVEGVTGRRTAEGVRGLPAIDEISFRLEDGTLQSFGMPTSGVEAGVDFVAEVFGQSFGICPICVGIATEDEHVPQGPLGGHIMTTTCAECNNDLGSKVEPELQAWFDQMLVDVAFLHDDVPGRRKVRPIYYRKGPDGFALIADGEMGTDVQRMFEMGTFSMEFREPDPVRYRLAALKHAYLAACLYLGYVPDFPEARRDQARTARGPRDALEDPSGAKQVRRATLDLPLAQSATRPPAGDCRDPPSASRRRA
jgi:hypothetical protein